MEDKIRIIVDFYAKLLKTVFKELEDYFKTKSQILPLDQIFKIIIGPDNEKKIMKQKELILNVASQWNGSEETFESLIDENFKAFLRSDGNYINFRKRHRKFEEVKELLKDTFRHKTINDYHVLQGTGETYYEIVKTGIPTKEEVLKLTNKEISLYERLCDFLKNNRGIVAVPGIIRVDIIDATIKFYELIIYHLKEETERIYGSN
jgi:hypothetical protein